MDLVYPNALSSAPVCGTCGMQYPPQPRCPNECPICLDERQYVGWTGQHWTTSGALASERSIRFEDSDGVMTLFLDPGFAIGQRAFLVPCDDGLVMWECLSTVTPEAIERISAMGEVKAIAISHPHFYAAMNEWSQALGGVPIYVHEADRKWVQFETPALRYWKGARLALSDAVELVHLPGHFAGSAGLWWKDGPRPGGSLFPGDAVQVVMDRRFVTFMYSYPNAIPLGPDALRRLEACVAPLAFDDVFGFSPGRQIIGGAKARVAASFARYRGAIAA
jgi:hypothetical protein